MKILMMSDSHGNHKLVEEIKNRHEVDEYFHMGDSESPTEFVDFHMVRGNYYLEPNIPYTKVLDIDSYRFMLTHGHLYNVNFTMLKLELAAKEANANVVCYGHTHRFHFEFTNGLYFINPGSITRNRDGVDSYAIFDTINKVLTRYSVEGEILGIWKK